MTKECKEMNSSSTRSATELIVVAVVPCYRETSNILGVLKKFDKLISHILIIDDACPDKTGELVREQTNDPRIEIIVHDTNQGLGVQLSQVTAVLCNSKPISLSKSMETARWTLA